MSATRFETKRDGREICSCSMMGQAEYVSRKMLMALRQEWFCAICGRYMMRDEVTFDHEAGRGMGGSKRDDRILHDDGSWRNAALCYTCNILKGSKIYRWVDGEFVPLRA